ncbi:MAG: nicotinate-nicotinamide nucleotide adenylyltransferase [Clostridia bacterium]
MHTYRESGAAYTSFYFSKPLKIAVMGGTFDPIHYGHLVTAEAVRHQYDIGQVLFVPTGHPPIKSSRRLHTRKTVSDDDVGDGRRIQLFVSRIGN